MKIKNKGLLVRRAEWHAKNDHVKQGTYGDSSCNGKVEFEGCAIGCLATPHTERGLRAFIRKLGEKEVKSDYKFDPSLGYSTWQREETGSFVLYEEDDDQLPRIAREFGINRALARAAEGLFESFNKNGEAINFIPAFARALPEGVNVRPDAVKRAWKRITGLELELETSNAFSGPYSNRYYGRKSSVPATEAARQFLAWLRSGAAA
jgi:hypothetical protein